MCVFGGMVDAAAAIRYVNDDASGGNDGLSWDSAYTNLQQALEVSMEGDQIWVAAGVYRPTNGNDIDASFIVRGGLSVYGGFAGTEKSLEERNWVANQTILSGDIGVIEERSDNSVHVVLMGSSKPSRLDGLIIRDGGNQFEGEGAGIYVPAGFFPPVTSAELGHIIANCTFTENHALTAGGALLVLQASVLVTNSTFVGNSGGWNGAISFKGQHIVVKKSLFTANRAITVSGGAVRLGCSQSAQIENCIFVENEAADRGGALIADNSCHKTAVVNSVFYKNLAGWDGGAIYAPNISVVNCTLVQNSAFLGAGGGIAGDVVSAVNSILWGNTAGADSQIKSGASVSVTFTAIEGGFSGEGNISSDPRFLSAATGDLQLTGASPAIDSGRNDAAVGFVTTDLSGNPRILPRNESAEERVDLGAYEYVNVIKFISAEIESNGDVLMRFVAPAGGSYQIEAAEALGAEWIALGTASSVEGLFQYLDTNAASRHRFYRARSL